MGSSTSSLNGCRPRRRRHGVRLRGARGGSGPDHTAVEGDEVTFSVGPGEDLGSVAARLDRAGIVASARAFERAARDTDSGLVRSGDFVLRERMPAAEALAVLQGATDGAVHYVLVERGRRLTEVLDAVAEATGLPREELEAAAAEAEEGGAEAGADADETVEIADGGEGDEGASE